MHLRLLAAAAVTAGLALSALSACSDDPEPILTPAPTETPTTTTTPSPTESESAEPEDPKAFIRRWVQVRNEMQNGGDTTAYRKLSRGCQPCIETAELVERYYRDGGYVRTPGWQILSLRETSVSTAQNPQFELKVRSDGTTYKETSNSEEIVLGPGTPTYVLDLRRLRGRWVVSFVVQSA